MPTHALARPTFAPIDHLRRTTSVMDRVAERQDRFLRQKARHAVTAMKEAKPKLMDLAVSTAEAGAVAFTFGFMHGRAPEKLMIGPVPLELAVGVGAHAIGVFGPQDMSSHMHAVGVGAIASFLHSLGRGVGRKARKAAGLPPAAESILAGEESEVTGGGALSDEELARLARRI